MLRKVRAISLFLIFISINLCATEKRADLVIYSFDRPTQLFALLESIDVYVTGLGDVTVIYRSSGNAFSKAYEEVIDYFPGVIFVKQGSNPRSDFKPLTLQAVFDSSYDYILFAVDDDIVKDFTDVGQSIEQMERYGAYAVYFKMGLHLSYCLPMASDQMVPSYKVLEDDLCIWCFANGKCDWGYPHTVDMTLYRKKDIRRDLCTMSYRSPNTFEGVWAGRARKIMHKRGLFYKRSKLVNLPLNRVQNDCCNSHMNAQSPQELLDLFNQGLKIDIFPLYQVENNDVHMQYVPKFVQRDDTSVEKGFVVGDVV